MWFSSLGKQGALKWENIRRLEEIILFYVEMGDQTFTHP